MHHPSSWRAGAGSFSSHPLLEPVELRRCHLDLEPSISMRRSRATPVAGISTLSRGHFSQAWRAEQSNPSLLMSTSSALTKAAVKVRIRFARERPCSKLCLDDFRLRFHAHISVNAICVLGAKISIKKMQSVLKTWS